MSFLYDEKARRSYWTGQMEAAYRFMHDMLAYPVSECGERLMFLPEVVEREGLSVQFSQTKIAGRHRRLFFLREGLIRDFIAVAGEMQERGWTLRVEDGFRSRVMQRDLAMQETIFDTILGRVMWEIEDDMPNPELMFRRLSALIATAPKVGTHMSGSAMDISVFRTEDLSEIERGGPYLELSELTPMNSPFVPAAAARNRTEISEVMQRHGFAAYPYEFWHYSKGDAYAEYFAGSSRPARYGPVDFDPVSGAVSPIEDPLESLHSPEDIEKSIKAALSRMRGAI